MIQALAVATGGALGALMRYGIGVWWDKQSGSDFPWDILFINLVGSLILGALYVPFSKELLSPGAQGLFMIGLLGSFTTFSTFSVQTMNLMHHGHAAHAVGYVVASVIGGLLCAVIGCAVMMKLMPGG